MNKLFIRIWGVNLAVVFLATLLAHGGFILSSRAQLGIHSEEYTQNLIEAEKKILLEAQKNGIYKALDYIKTLPNILQDQILIYNDRNFSLIHKRQSKIPFWLIKSKIHFDNDIAHPHQIDFYDQHNQRYYLKLNHEVHLPIWASPSFAGYLLRFSIAVFLSGLVALLLARNLCKPIFIITNQLNKIRNDFFETKIPETVTKRQDEVGQLARDFNQMIESIALMRHKEQRLLTDVAHDIRSPLSRQKLALSFLEKKEIRANPEKLFEYIERAQIENEKLSDLVDHLLIYFRSEKTDAIQFEKISLSQVIAEVVEAASFEFSTQNKFLECDLKEDIIVLGSYSELIRAFENILRNAMFYTHQATTVKVEVIIQAQHVTISIIDYGDGVDPAQLSKLSQAFFKTDTSRNNDQGGYGLGLPICQAIIKQHSGILSFENEVNAGLKVSITLPTVPINE